MRSSIISQMVSNISKEIKKGILSEGMECNYTLNMVLSAYNHFQDAERMGVDHLFNIDDKDDLLACVKGGLTAEEIAYLYDESELNTTKYFFYHPENHPKPKAIVWENLRDLMLDELESVLYAVIAHPWVESYRAIYTKYVCDYMINNSMIN